MLVLIPEVLHLGSALISCVPLYLPECLSNFWSRDLPCDVSSLVDLRRLTDFQFVHLFCDCKDQSVSLQAPYMPEQKPDLHVYFHVTHFPSFLLINSKSSIV